jgi:hypothetical protein
MFLRPDISRRSIYRDCAELNLSFFKNWTLLARVQGYDWFRVFNQFRTLGGKAEYQLKKYSVSRHTLGYPRFVKRENVETEILFIISQ